MDRFVAFRCITSSSTKKQFPKKASLAAHECVLDARLETLLAKDQRLLWKLKYDENRFLLYVDESVFFGGAS